MSLPTLTDLKVHLNITSENNDDELADILDAAVDVVGGIVGSVGSTAVTETHYGLASPTVLLRQMPVASVSAVTSRSYGASGSEGLTVADYELDTSAGLLRRVDGGFFYGDVSVVYAVGRSDLPAAIRLAILIIAAHLWETQRGTSPSALAVQQDTFTDPGTFGAAYAIPNRAKELLAPYVRPAVA